MLGSYRITGQLPDNWTVERLSQKRPSKPFNPDIANVLFRAGLIESWGRGTLKIIKKCQQAGFSAPIYRYNNPDFEVLIQKKGRKNRPFTINNILFVVSFPDTHSQQT
jgi:predicted HTH transcriptional regulator